MYFTKYLPVEGEKIEVGEKYINMNMHLTKHYEKGGSCYGGYPTCGNRSVDTRKAHQNNDSAFNGSKYSNRNYVKVKLFLCSRDIQVGDEYWYNQHGVWIKREYTWNGGDFKGNCLKVIGEISPDAVWVTKEMEFEEDDLRFWYKHRKFTDENFVIHSPVVDWKGEDKDKYRVIVKVKCPTCKTFH